MLFYPAKFAVKFCRKLAVLGMGFFGCRVRTEDCHFAVEGDLADIAFSPFGVGRSFETGRICYFRQFLVSGIFCVCARTEVFNTVVRGISIDVIDFIRLNVEQKLHNHTGQAKLYVVDAYFNNGVHCMPRCSLNVSMTSDYFSGMYSIFPVLVTFGRKMVARTRTPTQLSSYGVVGKALLQINLRWQYLVVGHAVPLIQVPWSGPQLRANVLWSNFCRLVQMPLSTFIAVGG